ILVRGVGTRRARFVASAGHFPSSLLRPDRKVLLESVRRPSGMRRADPSWRLCPSGYAAAPRRLLRYAGAVFSLTVRSPIREGLRRLFGGPLAKPLPPPAFRPMFRTGCRTRQLRKPPHAASVRLPDRWDKC